MTKQKEYAFVLDKEEKQLSPTNTNKAWYLIRKKKAMLIQKYPMVIKLEKVIENPDIDTSTITLGIDDGSKYVGIALVQDKKKVLLKGTMLQRQDVKKKMELRAGERRYRRSHKHYRPARFDNRANSRRRGRLAPSIKQKKQAILRVVNQLLKWVRIDKIILENVTIDIRQMMSEKKLYGNDYHTTDKLHPKLRVAALLRDNFTCQLTGKTNTRLEVHHIIPRRLGGSDTLGNVITLSDDVHLSITGRELQFSDKLFEIIKGSNKRFDFAQHVMQGKAWLQKELSSIAPLTLTTGVDTYEVRKELGVNKSHSNDALIIAGIDNKFTNLKDWTIKPLRKKKKGEGETVNGLRHRDVVRFDSKRSSQTFIGYISAIRDNGKSVNVTDFSGDTFRRYSAKSMQLLKRPKGLVWN